MLRRNARIDKFVLVFELDRSQFVVMFARYDLVSLRNGFFKELLNIHSGFFKVEKNSLKIIDVRINK
jgi:hypothetical protein